MSNQDHSVRNWAWDQVREVLRHYGSDIGMLARRGDPLATRLMQRYHYAHDHPSDMGANLALRDALNEYLQRDLTIRDRAELGAKFGHRLDQPRADGPVIAVPANYRKH